MPWKLTTEFTFDAAHQLAGYDGPCGRLHGHTYRVVLALTGDRLRSSAHLPRPAMLADFSTLKWARPDSQHGGLDHAFLNEIPDLGENSTAEVIAAYVHRKTMERIRASLHAEDDGSDLSLRVTLWETPHCCCEYWE